MTKNYFHEKIALLLSFLILNNYLLYSLNFSQLIIKANFVIFLIGIFVFYFKNISENIFLKIFFLFLVIISLGTPVTGWDARSIYLFQAKKIFYENSIFSGLDNYAAFSHNAYPNLAAAFASSFAYIVGHWNEVFPKLSFTFMFLPPLIVAYTFFKETLYLFFLSLVFFSIGNYLFNGLADGLVAVYFTFSAFFMYRLVIDVPENIDNKKIDYLMAFCFFLTLSLIKNEGIVLLLILFISTFLILLFKKKVKKNILILTFFSFSFLPVIAWKYFYFINGMGNEFININTISYLLPRIGNLENYQLISYFLFLHEKFLVVFLIFIVSFWIKRNKDVLIFVFLTALIYILILFIIYLSTPHDLFWQLNTTAARIGRSLNFLFAFFAVYNFSSQKI